jgi:FkbM family methyltransferase
LGLYQLRNGNRYWLDDQRYLHQEIIRSGVYESETTQFFNKFIKPGWNVIDIGANIGYYTVLLAKLTGPTGKVYTFEPTRKYFGYLSRNVRENDLNNVILNRIGLSNKKGKVKLKFDNSSATAFWTGDKKPEYSEVINLVSLDNYLKYYSMSRLDLIKVDVDGCEPDLLKGAVRTLKKYQPVIVMEVSHSHLLKYGITAWDYFSILKNLGYLIYTIENLIPINTLHEFLVNCGNFNQSTNIILTPRPL